MPEKIRVLYVDDEPDLLKIGKIYLEKKGGFTVETTISANEAFTLIQKEQYDAVISDYQMPERDGIAFLKTLRSSGNTLPFILFTGRGREEIVIQALNEGADFYLQKGGDPKAQFAELSHKIRRAVQQKRAEQALAESEVNLQAIIANTNDMIASYDSETRLIVYNKAYAEMYHNLFGIELHPGLRPLDLFPESMRGFWEVNNERALAGDSFTIQFSLPAPDGSTWIFESFYNPIQKDGGVVGFSTFTRDITAQKEAEKSLFRKNEELRNQFEGLSKMQVELQQQKHQLTEMTEMIPGLVYQFYARSDGSMGLYYVSQHGRELFGFSGEINDIFGWFSDHIDSTDRDAFIRSIERAINTATPWSFEGRFIRPSGDLIWFEGLSRPTWHGSELIFNGILLDITERKKIEMELANSRAMIDAAFEQTPLPMALISVPDMVVRYANKACIDFLGIGDEPSWIGLSFLEYKPSWKHFGPDGSYKPLRELPLFRCSRGEIVRNEESYIITKNGEKKWEMVSGSPIYNASGEIIAAYIIFPDITDRKQAEDGLQASETRFRELVDQFPEAVLEMDVNNRVIYANRMALDVFGYDLEEMVILPSVLECIIPEERRKIEQKLAWSLQGDYTGSREYTGLRKSGTTFPILLQNQVMTSNGKNTGFRWIITDNTG